MTIAEQVGKTGPYDGDGATTVFEYDFRILDEAHIVVTLADANGVETVQTLTTHYTVDNVGNDTGGDVTMVAFPLSTETLTLSRDIPLEQLTDYLNRGKFSPETTETALDKLTQITQDMSLKLRRALLFSISSGALDITLPTPASDLILGWNTAGDDLENKTPNTSGFITLPVGSTDNAHVRFDGAGGNAFQDSETIEDDSGNVTIGGSVNIEDGDAANPAVFFNGDSDTGFFLKSDGTIGISVAGVEEGYIDAGGMELTLGNLFTVDGVDVSAGAVDAELTAIAALTSAADKIIRYTGSGTADLLDFLDEDAMGSDSASALASQQSIKAYVDANVATGMELIATATPSSVTEVEFLNLEDYLYLEMVVNNVNFGAALGCVFSDDAGVSYGSSYRRYFLTDGSDGTSLDGSLYIAEGGNNNDGLIKFSGFNDASRTKQWAMTGVPSSSNTYMRWGHQQSGDLNDAIKVSVGSGVINGGTISLYGIKG